MDTMQVPLTRGLFATVDIQDALSVMEFRWHVTGISGRSTHYARSSAAASRHPKRGVMHRFILQCPDDSYVDHIDGNGLNNTRANLRLATSGQNVMNRGKRRGVGNGYKGVWLDVPTGRWRSAICINYKLVHLGMFKDALDAAIAYDVAARKHFGEFARPNFKTEVDLQSALDERASHAAGARA